MSSTNSAQWAILSVVFVSLAEFSTLDAWTIHGPHVWHRFQASSPASTSQAGMLTTRMRTSSSLFVSTPFELDFYDDGSDNPYQSASTPSPLSCPEDTKLVVGVNKYSHDTSLCAANAETGEVLFATSKERLSRVKHDAGNVVSLVETCLDALDLDDSAIETVVVNNHHHRVLPLEANRAHMEWESGLGINGGAEAGYDDEENLLGTETYSGETPYHQLEMSHHLAHAYSTAAQAPFDSGIVVVMDGMGETYRTMLRAARTQDPNYVSDLSFGEDSFTCIPSDLEEQSRLCCFDFREAESVYEFDKGEDGKTMNLKPIFKRFTPERSPPTLYNHGFENMDSVGALYSRASSHVFGDWNACGKVMGLAPWIQSSWNDMGDTLKPKEEIRQIMWGTLYSEDDDKIFQQNKDILSGMPLIARMDSDMFDKEGNLIRRRRYDFDDDEGSGSGGNSGGTRRLPTQVALEAIALAHRIQVDLEDVVMDFVRHFKDETGAKNLCIAGGVGLNSVLNGRLSRELGFSRTFVSPYPGDDGIAVGCCAFGLFGNKFLDDKKTLSSKFQPPIWKAPLSPYTGVCPTEKEIKAAIDEAAPWLEIDVIRDEDTLLEVVAQEIESGGVVAWYQGRSEMGPRALGHRSILADPRKKGLVRYINEEVKKRESFRPFAPSVLVEHATDWFDLGENIEDANVSPYMSLTAMVHEEKRSLIPAVTHVDGSSRLQTVTPESEPLYHRLISKFFELTGVPMVLNTSFNTLPSEPIVESPKNAIRSFLCSMGSIELLVMGDYVIKRKKANLRSLLGELDKTEDNMLTAPAFPKRTGRATFQTTFEADEGSMDPDALVTVTKVRMPDRPMHHEKSEWFEVMDELEGELLSVCDGKSSLNDILAEYTAFDKDTEANASHIEHTQMVVQNIVHRLVTLYENTLISW